MNKMQGCDEPLGKHSGAIQTYNREHTKLETRNSTIPGLPDGWGPLRLFHDFADGDTSGYVVPGSGPALRSGLRTLDEDISTADLRSMEKEIHSIARSNSPEQRAGMKRIMTLLKVLGNVGTLEKLARFCYVARLVLFAYTHVISATNTLLSWNFRILRNALDKQGVSAHCTSIFF